MLVGQFGSLVRMMSCPIVCKKNLIKLILREYSVNHHERILAKFETKYYILNSSLCIPRCRTYLIKAFKPCGRRILMTYSLDLEISKQILEVARGNLKHCCWRKCTKEYRLQNESQFVSASTVNYVRLKCLWWIPKIELLYIHIYIYIYICIQVYVWRIYQEPFICLIIFPVWLKWFL